MSAIYTQHQLVTPSLRSSVPPAGGDDVRTQGGEHIRHVLMVQGICAVSSVAESLPRLCAYGKGHDASQTRHVSSGSVAVTMIHTLDMYNVATMWSPMQRDQQ